MHLTSAPHIIYKSYEVPKHPQSIIPDIDVYEAEVGAVVRNENTIWFFTPGSTLYSRRPALLHHGIEWILYSIEHNPA